MNFLLFCIHFSLFSLPKYKVILSFIFCIKFVHDDIIFVFDKVTPISRSGHIFDMPIRMDSC